MAKINFSSGEVYEFSGEVSVYDAASALGIISRDVVTAKVNGELTELSTKITDDADVALYTVRDDEGTVSFANTSCAFSKGNSARVTTCSSTPPKFNFAISVCIF